MCLQNLKTEKPQIADKDIVVYKRLEKSYESCPEYDGKVFVAEICGGRVKGHISIQDGIMYLCQDEREGTSCKDKKGYCYSWQLDFSVTNLEIGGKKAKDGFITPYQYTPIKLGETYTSSLERIERYGNYEVEEGLHSYLEVPSKEEMEENEVLVQCIIPKGSEYYEGYFNNNPSIASDTLKYVKLI